jgi:hypothetical protein
MNTGIEIIKERYDEYGKHKYPNVPDKSRVYPTCLNRAKQTNGLTQCIILYLKLKGWASERVSSSGRYIDSTKIVTDTIGRKRKIGSGKYIPGTSKKGTADISASINGMSVKIEVKNEATKDRVSPDQVHYKNEVEISGAIYYIARNLDDTVRWIDANFPDNPRKIEFWNLDK